MQKHGVRVVVFLTGGFFLFLLVALLTPLASAGIGPAGVAQSNSTSDRQVKPAPARSRTVKPTVPKRNLEITRIVAQIDPRHIEATIRKLVSFGTRNTLSDQNDPHRGIGAARDWLYGEFQKAAQQSGGRMSVEKQAFEQAKAARVATAHNAHEYCRDLERDCAGFSQSCLRGQRSLRFDV